MALALADIAPKWARDRARARLQLAHYEHATCRLRGYDAASKSRRMAGWKKVDSGPPSTGIDLELIRQRARDVVRNSPFAASAVGAVTADVVGEGIRARIVNTQGKPARVVSKRWLRWSESTDCDADGRLDFYGLQALVMRTVMESGECLVRKRPRRRNSGLSTPLQLQVIEPEYLDASKDGKRLSGNRVIGGIEVDRRGRRVAYHLRTEHPATTGVMLRADRTVRVSATDVLHLYRVDRPGQMRGVSWLAPVIPRLRLLDDYEDAALERARVAACFSAFIYDPDNGGMGGAFATPDDGLERLEPSLTQTLGPGPSR